MSLFTSDNTNKENQRDRPPRLIRDKPLRLIEKTFLLYVERGDISSARRCLGEASKTNLDINCLDPLGRSSLVIAIENENLELVEVLLEFGTETKDALLHAISEEYVEAVELLLEHEERSHVPGDSYSWESVDPEKATFTPDITPLILAAHRNNYEILKLLLDRGATLPVPHDVKCGCDECVINSRKDSLKHSRARINAYRALCSPSLVALSSRDPILTAFELSYELRRLSAMETEFCVDYQELRVQCQDFAVSLLDHTRTSYELEALLNHNTEGPAWQPGEHMQLERLKLAIKYEQKKFVAHPSVQQLLASIWYEGVPGFRRKNMVSQLFEVAKMGSLFPFYSLVYIFFPSTEMGQFMTKPFVRFICHSASYFFFLFLLCLASQRVEHIVIELFGTDAMQQLLHKWKEEERGSLPGYVESLIILWIVSLIWFEVRQLWEEGILEYISDMWNIVDFINYTFFVAWIGLRAAAWIQVQHELSQGKNPYYPRELWHDFDPMLLSEGMFSAAMVLSFLKLVHIFSVNQYLGPLQISLGRMVYDIMKFFFIYTLVLFAFGCGMNQLLWYYAERDKQRCYNTLDGRADWDNEAEACSKWRRFANLFETSQSLFWASFGLVDIISFDLSTIKSYTRFWGLLMFGSYSVINVVVLLNLLIAMMSNSYQSISERSDVEWKFARSTLWMSYFEQEGTVPPPLNIVSSFMSICRSFRCKKKPQMRASQRRKSLEASENRYQDIMQNLVRRYVTLEQCKTEEQSVTEDDVNEIKQDISSFRYELLDILRNNGMNTKVVHTPTEKEVTGKKNRTKERRLLKGFNIGFVEGASGDLSESLLHKSGSKLWKVVMIATGRYPKRNWNDAVAAMKCKQDQIGSSRWSIMRRSTNVNSHEDTDNSRETSHAVRLAGNLFKSRLKSRRNSDDVNSSVTNSQISLPTIPGSRRPSEIPDSSHITGTEETLAASSTALPKNVQKESPPLPREPKPLIPLPQTPDLSLIDLSKETSVSITISDPTENEHSEENQESRSLQQENPISSSTIDSKSQKPDNSFNPLLLKSEESLHPEANASSPRTAISSPIPTGRSAVTKQVRTGWL